MRPDEHKKKKNAAYKKKHKIHVDKKSGSDSQERDSGRSGHLSDNCLQSDSMSQREELETSKVYCRRKVENNWEKYEEPAASTETETDLSLHGADYQQLLNATCGVKAEYQFVSFEPDDTEPDNEQFVNEFLSMDCQRLTQSVQCVPLHQRLLIDESLFDKSEIEAFNAAALARLSRLEQTRGNTASSESGQVLNVDSAADSCRCVDNLPAVSTDCQQHAVTSSAAASRDPAAAAADSSLSQLEHELDSLLPI